MQLLKILPCLLLGNLGLGGCATDDAPARAAAAPLTTAVNVAAWPHDGISPVQINVCFAAQALAVPGFTTVPGFHANPGDGPGYRDWIIDAIQESWGRAGNLSITFAGSCPATLGAGWVVIHFNDQGHPQQETLFLGYLPQTQHLWLNHNRDQGAPPASFNHHACGFTAGQSRPAGGGTYESLEELRRDAQRLFGEVLGFSDNSFDPDQPIDARCLGPHFPPSDDGSPNVFDFGSVMDLCARPCQMDTFGDTRPYFRAKLSDWDVFDLQVRYGGKQASGGNFIIGHRNTSIEVPGSHFVAGQALEIWDFKANPNETWLSINAGAITPKAATSLLWDVRGNTTSPTAGTPIQLYPAQGLANQVFNLAGVEWRGAGDNCVQATTAAAGSALALARCSGATLQQWNITYGVTSTQFRLANTNLCATSPAASPANQAALTLATCGTSFARQTFVSAVGGALALGGKCLDVRGGGPSFDPFTKGASPRSLDPYDASFAPTRPALPIQFFTCLPTNANLNQQFHAHGPITGLNSQCVDIADGIGTRGAAIQMFRCTGNPNQIWDAYIF